MPMFRRKKWDGYVYLFNHNNGKVYYGLKREVERFANDRNYELVDKTDDPIEHISNEDYYNFLISFLCEYQLRDYQNTEYVMLLIKRDVSYWHLLHRVNH